MPSAERERVIKALEKAVPDMQRDFVMSGPLRGSLPADIRADIVRVFTQVLCRAVKDGDGAELGGFVDSVVWESRKLGVAPSRYLDWIDRYRVMVRRLLDDDELRCTEPMLTRARNHIQRLQS